MISLTCKKIKKKTKHQFVIVVIKNKSIEKKECKNIALIMF